MTAALSSPPSLKTRTSEPGFEKVFQAYCQRSLGTLKAVQADVEPILKAVSQQGDKALRAFTEQWDGHTGLVVSVAQRDAAAEQVAPDLREALRAARDRIQAFHMRQKPQNDHYTDALGVTMGWHWRALESVGIYVPGGRAAYPSTVLMNAIPARIAGVENIHMAVPTPQGHMSPAVMAAAALVGIERIYSIGGAQAIAAFAYGTETVARVDKIVGPGNAYVAAAKQALFGQVGVDMVAGPSELVILADSSARAAWVAADLLAQAEHDPRARAVLLTDDEGLWEATERAVAHHLARLPRPEVARQSWTTEGGLIRTASLQEAVELANALAPEHLALYTEQPEPLVEKIHHAGAIFQGAYAPEVLGDYLAGPSHVLPTSGTARFASGLSVLDFMKRTHIIAAGPEAFQTLRPKLLCLARAEGLTAHALSADIRGPAWETEDDT